MYNQDKIQYLQMVMDIINRMSNISIAVKGAFATLFIALIAIIIEKDTQSLLLIGALLPFVALLSTDIYYLFLEKQYRILYEKIRNDEINVDFNLAITDNIVPRDEVLGLLFKCFKSWSIIIFYLPFAITYIVLLLKKYEVFS